MCNKTEKRRKEISRVTQMAFLCVCNDKSLKDISKFHTHAYLQLFGPLGHFRSDYQHKLPFRKVFVFLVCFVVHQNTISYKKTWKLCRVCCSFLDFLVMALFISTQSQQFTQVFAQEGITSRSQLSKLNCLVFYKKQLTYLK